MANGGVGVGNKPLLTTDKQAPESRIGFAKIPSIFVGKTRNSVVMSIGGHCEFCLSATPGTCSGAAWFSFPGIEMFEVQTAFVYFGLWPVDRFICCTCWVGNSGGLI